MYASGFAQQLASIGATTTFNADMAPERLARIASRRAFVEMKQRFMQIVSKIDGPEGDELRERVRLTQQPSELWLLRTVLIESRPELSGFTDPQTLLGHSDF